MPYFLSPNISESILPMWNEGAVYQKENIYKITEGGLPPVNYDKHSIKPHSLTHIETPAHTSNGEKRLEHYLTNHKDYFYGPTSVLKINSDIFKTKESDIWEVSLEEIQTAIESHKGLLHNKVLISPSFYVRCNNQFQLGSQVFTLSEEAASFLCKKSRLHLFGTSWKSTDYNPGERSRPIHNIIFRQGIILENLDLLNVPAGNYFMTCLPLPLTGASESPVAPILFSKNEISNFII